MSPNGGFFLHSNCLVKYMTKVDDVEEKKKCLVGCGEKETVEHLLTCPLYGRERHMICRGGSDILKLLNEDPTKVLEFLNLIGVRPLPTCQQKTKDRESTERESTQKLY